MALPVPAPSSATAGGKILASDWNAAVRDAVLYLLELQGGAGRRNLLANASFNIWQSGTSAIGIGPTGQWTADQWFVSRDSNGTCYTQQKGFGDSPADSFYGIRLQVMDGSQAGGVTEILQPIETQNCVFAAGHLMSLRVRMDRSGGFSGAGEEVGVQVITGSGSDEDYTAGWTNETLALDTVQALGTDADTYIFSEILIPSDAREIAVRFFWTNVGRAADDAITLYNVQLAVGATAAFENIGIQQDYAECQRFYQAGELLLFTHGTSGTSFSATQVLPTTMRTTPTYGFVANTVATNFPATASALHGQGNSPREITRSRVCSGTGSASWGETYTLDARLI